MHISSLHISFGLGHVWVEASVGFYVLGFYLLGRGVKFGRLVFFYVGRRRDITTLFFSSLPLYLYPFPYYI